MAKEPAAADGRSASEKPAKQPPETHTPPEHAKAHGLEPVDAAGVRATGGWELYDRVTEAAYRAALRKWQGGNSHGS